MITDTELQSALEAWADEIPVPDDGPARVRAAAGAAHPTSGARLAVPRRRVAWAVLAAAAVAAVAAISTTLVTSSPAPVERVAIPPLHASGAFNARASASAGAASQQIAPLQPAVPSAPAATPKGSATPAKITSSGKLALTVRRSSLAGTVSSLRSLADGDGGYLSSSNVSQAKRGAGGTVVVEVPAGTFSSLVTRAQHLGTTTSISTSATDVTKQVADTAARISALVDVRSQLEALLKRTGKVSDLLAVEQQIESTQSEIDQLQAEQASLGHEVAYATLTVSLHVAQPAPPKKAHPSSLDRAWSKAVTGFTGGLKWLLSVSGLVLFALVLAAVLAVLLRLFIRRGWPRVRRIFL